MNLFKQISMIRPVGTFEIMDIGKGQFIHPLIPDFVQPTAAEMEAAAKLCLKAASSVECLHCIGAIINPLDGQPLSKRTDSDQMRTDALVGWANAKDYTTLSTASQPVIDAIKAAITERFRLLGCHSTNKDAIDGGTITTEAQVLDPARW